MEELSLCLRAIHVGLGIAIGLGYLFVRRAPPSWRFAWPTTANIVTAVIAVAMTSVVSTALSIPFGVNLFGIIHLFFLDLMIVAPFFGLVLVGIVLRAGAEGAAPAKWRLVAGAFVLLALGSCAWWAHYGEPFRLVVERPFVGSPSIDRSLEIGILADLQTDAVGRHERAAIDLLMADEPDLILIPGDLFQGTDARFDPELPALRRLLARLEAPLGVFAVIGNTDQRHQFDAIMRGTTIQALHDRSVSIETEVGTVVLGGVTYGRTTAAAGVVQEVARKRASGALTIVLAHDPGKVYDLPVSPSPEFLIGGHTHGGQVRLPFIGALLTLSNLPRRFASGLHRWRDSWLYVSRGVGVERAQAPRMRFLCPPEITILTITPAAKQAETGP